MSSSSLLPFVAFGGSRSLPSSAAPLVAQVVRFFLRSSYGVSVGCSAGADQFVLSAALAASALPGRLRVFAVGSSAGAGFVGSSAPLSLLRSAAAAGASVSWLAGGFLAVPVRARLARRSVACVAGCACGVFFLSSPSSRGSLLAAGRLAASGSPVVAFCFGFSSAPLPLPGCPGCWLPGFCAGLPCFRWQADQPSLL